MALFLPESTDNIEQRLKADVKREAPDSNPYLSASWLRSLIAGFARRIFDFYEDLRRTERRVFPDTADEDTALLWGDIYIGERNPETAASGNIVATGVVGSTIPAGTTVTANDNEYITQTDLDIIANSLNIQSMTLTGTTVTVITSVDHHLSSSVPVTITGANELDYNLIDTDIVVIDTDAFTFQIAGTPTTPATGTITANFISGHAEVVSVAFGSSTNLDADSPLSLQSPVIGVDDEVNADFGAIGGGADTESFEDYKARYLEKIRNPVAQYNVSAVIAKAKEVTGVTRVFVQQSGEVTGTFVIDSLEVVSPNVVKATTLQPHLLDDGQEITINGATDAFYNVTNARVITELNNVFYYSIIGNPASPATGTFEATATVPLGQSITYFMRDGDANPIPTASEVATVKAKIDEIRPVNTSENNNIVRAPTPLIINYNITNLVPDTVSMREAIDANLQQFHDESVTVGKSLDQDLYRAAIANTVDLTNGQSVQTFELTTPIGDVPVNTGEIAQKGAVDFV